MKTLKEIMRGDGLWPQLVRYVVTGGLAFLLDFGLLWLMVSGLGLNAGFSAAVAVTAGTLFSYLVQKYFTFNSHGAIAGSAVRYLILFVWNTLVTALVVQAFQSWWDLYMVGKIFVTALITLWNFPLMRHWVYSGRGIRRPGRPSQQ